MVSDYDGSWESNIDEFAELILSGLDGIWEVGWISPGRRGDLPDSSVSCGAIRWRPRQLLQRESGADRCRASSSIALFSGTRRGSATKAFVPVSSTCLRQL